MTGYLQAQMLMHLCLSAFKYDSNASLVAILSVNIRRNERRGHFTLVCKTVYRYYRYHLLAGRSEVFFIDHCTRTDFFSEQYHIRHCIQSQLSSSYTSWGLSSN